MTCILDLQSSCCGLTSWSSLAEVHQPSRRVLFARGECTITQLRSHFREMALRESCVTCCAHHKDCRQLQGFSRPTPLLLQLTNLRGSLQQMHQPLDFSFSAKPTETHPSDLLQVRAPDIGAVLNTRATSFTAPHKTEQDQSHRKLRVPL